MVQLSSSGDKARSRNPLSDKNLRYSQSKPTLSFKFSIQLKILIFFLIKKEFKIRVTILKVLFFFIFYGYRDAKLKRRGQSQSSFISCDYRDKFNDDSENRNPNLSTPSNYQKSMKQMIKSSSEKNKPIDDVPQTSEAPRLKSTLSAKNLFAGKDILGHITEFCNELKKLATRAREKESLNEESQMGEKKDGVVVNEGSREVLGELNVKEKERKPLLNNDGEKSEGNERGSVKEKQRRKK